MTLRARRNGRFGSPTALQATLAAVSAAQGKAAETAGKPTYAALTAGLRLTAVMLGVVAG
jgi:hypothetical protein